MSEFKGTKGAWKINRNNIPDLPEAEFEIEGGNMQVAIAFDYDDAKLIASAPELLEALQDILNNGLNPVTYKVAQKAISKALG